MKTDSKVDYTSEEFWKDAPEGATHYYKGKFWKPVNGIMFKWEGKELNRPLNNEIHWARSTFVEQITEKMTPRPQPKPVYTQEMHDKGKQAPVGSEVMIWFNGDSEPKWDKITWYGVNNGHPCFVYKDEQCWPKTTDYKIKPIDTRTDEEKAIDVTVCSLMFYGDQTQTKEKARLTLNAIIEGKIHGVTWSKGNE